MFDSLLFKTDEKVKCMRLQIKHLQREQTWEIDQACLYQHETNI